MTRTSLVLAALIVSAVVAGATPARAQSAPDTIGFTGRLATTTGPVDGMVSLSFRLYDQPVAGAMLWQETHAQITAADGLVYAELGRVTPLSPSLFDGRGKYLEVIVNGTALAPRLSMLSVPYALHADSAGLLGGLAPDDVQVRVASTCAAGSAIRAIGADGAVTCEPDDDLALAGSGAAATAARSDHNHAGIYLPVGGTLSCAAGAKVTGLDAAGNVQCGADAVGTGDITGVTAGAGLTGGGASGDVGLAVAFAGTGAASTAARSDHHHAGAYLPLGGSRTCAAGAVVTSIDASGNVGCSADATGAQLGGTNTWTGAQTFGAAVDLRTTVSTTWATRWQHNEAWGANANRTFLNKGWHATYGDYLYLGSTGNRSNTDLFAMILGGGGVWFGKGTDAGTGLSQTLVDIDGAGNLTIGTGTTGCVRDRDGSIIAGTCSSDRRFKRDVLPFGPTLARVRQLQPVSYSWRTDEFPDRRFGAGRTDGLIAQDTAAVMPELVTRDADGYLAVHYEKLPFLLLQSTRELADADDQTRARIAALEAKVEALATENATLRGGVATAPASRQVPIAPVGVGAGVGVLGLAAVLGARRRT